MRIGEKLKTKRAEEIVGSTTFVVVLLLLPMFGALAMMVGSGVALVAYAILFRERVSNRGWLKTVFPIAVAGIVAAVIALALTSLSH